LGRVKSASRLHELGAFDWFFYAGILVVVLEFVRHRLALRLHEP